MLATVSFMSGLLARRSRNLRHTSPPHASSRNRERIQERKSRKSNAKDSRSYDAQSTRSYSCSSSRDSSPSTRACSRPEENPAMRKKAKTGQFRPAGRFVIPQPRFAQGDHTVPHPLGARQFGPFPRTRVGEPLYDAPRRWVGAGPKATAPKLGVWYNCSDVHSTGEKRPLPGRKARFDDIQPRIDNAEPETADHADGIVVPSPKLCYTRPPTGPSAAQSIHCEHFSFADEVRKCEEERCRLLRLRRHCERSEYFERRQPSTTVHAARQRKETRIEAQRVVNDMRKYLRTLKPGRMDREREQATKRLEINLLRLKMANAMEKIEKRHR